MIGIFEIDLKPLPCYQEGINESVYENYKNIFMKEFRNRKKVKILEIGSGTGCQIATIYKSCLDTEVLYFGYDIHPNSLVIAQQTAQIIKEKYNKFEYVLIEGNSNISQIQRTIALSGPYDIILIDGDVKFKSVVNDLKLAANCITTDGIAFINNCGIISDIQSAINFAMNQKWFEEVEIINGISVIRKTKKAVLVENKHSFIKKEHSYPVKKEKIYTGEDSDE